MASTAYLDQLTGYAPPEEVVPAPAQAAPPQGAASTASLDAYSGYQEPAPQQQAPQQQPAAPVSTSSLDAFTGYTPSEAEQAYVAEQNASVQSNKGYVPGTNPVVDTMYGVGNAIGGVVEAVGGPDLRKNLEGAAPPIKDIAEADGIKDKLLTVANAWGLPQVEATKRMGEEAIARQDGTSQPKESYNVLSPEGLATAGQQFVDELGNIKDHPEDIIYSMADDFAESGAFTDQGVTDVLGQVKDDPTKVDDFLTGQLRPSPEAAAVEQDEQSYYEWADANPDRVEANRETPENLYNEYLTSVGATWEEGGLLGVGKGLVYGAGTDPLTPITLGVGTVAGAAAKGLGVAGKVGGARGVLMTEKVLNTALGGPEDVALGIVGKGVSNLVPQPIKSIFQPSEEGQRVIGAQERREVGTDIANTRQAAGFPANRVGTPFQTTPFVAADFGPRKRPSTSVWAIDPVKGITRDGNVPTIQDLNDVRAELLDMRPGEVYGFDQADLVGLAPTDPRFRRAMMRGALTQGITRTKAGKAVKTPYMVDDFPLNFKGASNPAAHRYTNFLAERIRRYGDEEVEHILRSLNNTKYRGKRGQTQPVEMWYDSMRQLVANALVKAKYSKPVDLGVTHRFDATTGTYKPAAKRLVINPKAAGKPLNIDDFEPDAALWAKIQASAHPSSRITTPPPVRTPSVANNAPPPPITTTGWKLPFTRKKPSDWALSDSLDEFDGLAVADGHIPYLRQKVGTKTFYRTIADEQDEVYRMLDLAQGRAMGAPDELDKLTKKFTADYKKLYGDDVEPDFTRMGTFEANEFAATVATQRWLDALPPLKRKEATGLLGSIKKLSLDIGSFRSSVGLYNWSAAPRQTIVQHTGNVFALLLTKPSAITGMFNAKTAKAYFDAARAARRGLAPGQRVHSTTLDAMQKMGLGTNAMVSDSGKNIVQRGKAIGSPGARDEGSILARPMRFAKKIMAPDVVGDIVAIPDGMFRDSIISDFTPTVRRMQKSYPKEAASLAQDWVRAKGLKVPPAEVNKVVEKAFKTHFDPEARVSTINMTQLEDAIFDAFKHLPDQATTRNFANRVARDYKTRLNNQYQSTAAEAKKIAFSWDYNRLDDALKHVFLYHYWASRATGLYAKQLLKNPWIAASYARLAIALNEEAEANDYSPWMQGFSQLLSSPGGSILMANPLSMIGAMGIFADWQYGMEPERFGSDITEMGRYRGIAPAFINPLWDGLLQAFGVYGGEDAPTLGDPTGLERIPRDAIRLINLANLNGHLPEGMLRDANGNPILLGEKPLSDIWQKFISGASGIIRDDPQPIKDLYASQTSQTIAYAYQELMGEHPDWTEDMLTREVSRMATDAANGAPADPIWLEAERARLEADLRGPEFQQLPPGLRELFGGFLRNVSPMQMVNRPEVAMALRATPITPIGREPMALPEMGDVYDRFDMSSALYDTNEMTAFGIKNEDSFGDPRINEASKKRTAIVNATNPDGEIVNGVHYSQQQIMDMTDARRYALGREAMEEMGVTEAMRQSNYDAQRMMEENDPQLQEFKGYLDAIKNHPGGLEGFVDEKVKSDPAFARAMDESGQPPGTEDWYAAAKWPQTFMAASGERTSLYDPLTVPDGMDMSAYGEQRAADQAAYEDNSYSAKTERSVNEFMLAQKLLDQEYPGYGYRVGAGNLPSDVWNNMKTVWGNNDIDTAYITKSNHYGAQYVQWVLANPNLDDTSVQAYLDATMTDDGSNKFADGTATPSATKPEETFDLNAPVNMAMLSEMFGLPQKNQTPSGQLVFPSASVDLRQTPGGSRLTVLAPKTPLRLLERSGDWALVAGPGGWQGYVPVLSLLTAA